MQAAGEEFAGFWVFKRIYFRIYSNPVSLQVFRYLLAQLVLQEHDVYLRAVLRGERESGL